MKPAGRMILPVGSEKDQVFTVIDKLLDGTVRRSDLMGVMYAPLTNQDKSASAPSGTYVFFYVFKLKIDVWLNS